jgi:hypothetical protein
MSYTGILGGFLMLHAQSPTRAEGPSSPHPGEATRKMQLHAQQRGSSQNAVKVCVLQFHALSAWHFLRVEEFQVDFCSYQQLLTRL